MGSSSTPLHPTIDREAVYVYASPPPSLPISVAKAEGPYLILVCILCLLCGANTSLYAIYIYLFGGRKRDPYILQLSVFTSVVCNVILALSGMVFYFKASLVDLYTYPGYDINRIEWYVPLFHTLQALPNAIGQIYFTLRIAKLFDYRKISTRVGVGMALLGIAVQFGLMNWFGGAFVAVKYKSHLLDSKKRRLVRGILNTWSIIFVSLEISMTVTTMARLVVLRRQTSMAPARRVIFNLAVYSLQGQVILTTCSLTSLWLFSRSLTGWYTPMYLMSGSLYTMVLLANLIYRQAVGKAMRQAQSDYSPSSQQDRARGINFDAVCTYTGETPNPNPNPDPNAHLHSTTAQPSTSYPIRHGEAWKSRDTVSSRTSMDEELKMDTLKEVFSKPWSQDPALDGNRFTLPDVLSPPSSTAMTTRRKSDTPLPQVHISSTSSTTPTTRNSMIRSSPL
ncbi:uncharacterized protein UTRI_04374_B [Ustilago trichophora]|uniref:Uncharacterized protein n=1 Tax=Ustilago trichophora TaxID=86804 RepID=A0A5C3EA65_9BASI|nr:uncharacterized protein UTRI_04374_B [Ustilago trichophora]